MNTTGARHIFYPSLQLKKAKRHLHALPLFGFLESLPPRVPGPYEVQPLGTLLAQLYRHNLPPDLCHLGRQHSWQVPPLTGSTQHFTHAFKVPGVAQTGSRGNREAEPVGL